VRDWRRRYGPAAKPLDGPLPETPEAMSREIQQLRKELARVRAQRDILKKNHGHSFGSIEGRYRMIEELCKEHAVQDLCEVLEVSRSGYYAWCRGQESGRELGNRILTEQIKQLFESKRGRYGSPRITEELRRSGQCCNHKRVERLMRQEGLKGRTGKGRKVRTTHSDHDQPIAPNRLLERSAPTKPMRSGWPTSPMCRLRRAGCLSPR